MAVVVVVAQRPLFQERAVLDTAAAQPRLYSCWRPEPGTCRKKRADEQ
jgi:hypothetical protein